MEQTQKELDDFSFLFMKTILPGKILYEKVRLFYSSRTVTASKVITWVYSGGYRNRQGMPWWYREAKPGSTYCKSLRSQGYNSKKLFMAWERPWKRQFFFLFFFNTTEEFVGQHRVFICFVLKLFLWSFFFQFFPVTLTLNKWLWRTRLFDLVLIYSDEYKRYFDCTICKEIIICREIARLWSSLSSVKKIRQL